jgi:hypothetical protein
MTQGTRIVLAVLLAIVALNAFGGGVYGLLGAEGVPPSWLEGSPFRTYVVPSLVLLVVVGGSAALAAVLVLRGAPMSLTAAVAAGAILLVWIVVQVAIIGWVSWLQPTMALAAVAILGLASTLRGRVRA